MSKIIFRVGQGTENFLSEGVKEQTFRKGWKKKKKSMIKHICIYFLIFFLFFFYT